MSERRVTFEFDSEKAKKDFLVGLCDGWGESIGLMPHWIGDLFDTETIYIADPVEEEDDDEDDEMGLGELL